ncbi:MAG TPA: amidohydrolase family protein, partial [Myxococcaceae bacterium]|nr:amidohydrolase family protein [Myxococcaceae bacterium]
RELPAVAPDLAFAAVTRRPDLVPAGVEPIELPARLQETRMAWTLPRLLRRLRPDLAHFQHALPLGLPGRSVVTVHDLSFETDPAAMGRLDRLVFRTVVPRAVRAADHVLTVSERTRRDVIARYGIPEEKVTVTPNGVDPSFSPGEGRDGYLLFVGAIQRRKDPLAALAAARDVGLRIVLLRAGYHRAGYRAPDNPRQRRFYDASPADWLRAAADLRARTAADPLVTVGLAPHSVRAVPRSWLEEAARAEAWLLHMHVAEQPEEVVVCQAEYDRRPVELLADLGLLSPAFTAVHAVHTLPHERDLLQGASVCACPTTERDLGDGVLAADGMLRAGARLCIGTDSQATLDLFDELRAMEGSLRLTRGRRAVLDAPPGPDGLGRLLLSFASENGARALGLPTGILRPGAPADLLGVDLDHPSLAGASPSSLVASVVFGAPAAAVRDVAVQGRWVVRDGRHPLAEASGQAYAQLCRRIFAP